MTIYPDITIEQARAIVDNRANGYYSDISPGKGGRTWLEGEWRLSELEALCIVIRHEAGEHAEGAKELLANRTQMDQDENEGLNDAEEDRVEEPASDGSERPLPSWWSKEISMKAKAISQED